MRFHQTNDTIYEGFSNYKDKILTLKNMGAKFSLSPNRRCQIYNLNKI